MRPIPLTAACIAGNGMVFAEVHMLGHSTAQPIEYMIAMYAGHSKGGVVDGLYATALPPGEYTLDEFSRYEGGTSSGYGGVNVNMSEYSKWPVHRTFTIRAGEITNLGEIVIMPQTASADRKFNIACVDNSADAPYLFKTRYPQLVTALHPDTMYLAPGDYATADQLTRLRAYIASDAWRQAPMLHYFAGPAGTLAMVERDKVRNSPVVKLLDSGTTVGLVAGGEDRAHNRFAYSTFDGRAYEMRSGRAQAQSRPDGVDFHFPIYLAGDHLAVLPASGFTIYTSTDDGVSWNRSGNLIDNKGETGQFTHYGFAHDEIGMFVYRSYPARIMYSTLDSRQFDAMAIPAEVKEIRNFTVLKSSIVLEPRTMVLTLKTPYPFWVRARSGGDWQLRHLPRGDCGSIYFQDDSGQKVRTACGHTVFGSADGGEHWDVVS